MSQGSFPRAPFGAVLVVGFDVRAACGSRAAAWQSIDGGSGSLALVPDGVGCRAMKSDPDASAGDLPGNHRSGVSPDVGRSYRYQLTPGEDVIDTATWAGSVPQVNGIAPRVRVGRSRWFNLLWLFPIGFLLLIVLVAVAKGLRGDAFMRRFIGRYPGTDVGTPPAGTVGFPAWVDLQHFSTCFS